ncbi:hypothetical protein Nepgr_028318 [Nepenthes gracilis]|uniref:Uncharacterized protein n=1 Tax=Nepenthes gracilis TaxID=150966 RepID=A0AAD3Y3U2_NEPGR|nr:hypothetical protein Nepgr_028318 [Nepenthes gracilis]
MYQMVAAEHISTGVTDLNPTGKPHNHQHSCDCSQFILILPKTANHPATTGAATLAEPPISDKLHTGNPEQYHQSKAGTATASGFRKLLGAPSSLVARCGSSVRVGSCGLSSADPFDGNWESCLVHSVPL